MDKWAAAFLLSLIAIPAAAGDFRDVDVEEIKRAAALVMPGQITQISRAYPNCLETTETDCTAEVRLTIMTANGQNELTVSRIAGHWMVGRRQMEALAFEDCTKALLAKWRQEDADGVIIDLQRRRKEGRDCLVRTSGFADVKGMHSWAGAAS